MNKIIKSKLFSFNKKNLFNKVRKLDKSKINS